MRQLSKNQNGHSKVLSSSNINSVQNHISSNNTMFKSKYQFFKVQDENSDWRSEHESFSDYSRPSHQISHHIFPNSNKSKKDEITKSIQNNQINPVTNNNIRQIFGYSLDTIRIQNEEPTHLDGTTERNPTDKSQNSGFKIIASAHDAGTAASMKALAFTSMDKIHLPPGLQRPQTKKGREVVAHEIIHALQWQNGNNSNRSKWSKACLENEAKRLALNLVNRKSITVHGVHRGVEALKHPIFISTHGSRPYLNAAEQFYIRWGYDSPTWVSSIEEMLQYLAAGRGTLSKVTLVSHAVPENINISFFRGGPGFVLENDWEIDTPEEIGEQAVHVTSENYLRNIHNLLQTNPDAKHEMDLLERGGWLNSPILKQYLWWLLDAWYISGQRARNRNAIRQRDGLVNEALSYANSYRDMIMAVLAPIFAVGGSGPRFSFTNFERIFNHVMRNQRPQQATLASLRRLIRNPRNPQVQRLLRETVTNENGFIDNIDLVRQRMSENSHIEVQGCRIGRQRSYLHNMSRFFNNARITAPDWFQIFGHIGFQIIPRDNDAAMRRLWSRQEVRNAFIHWYPIIMGHPLTQQPGWENLAAYLRGGHPLIVGRRLLIIRHIGQDAFIEFLRNHGYRMSDNETIRQTFIEGRDIGSATRFAIIDWLQESRSTQSRVIFRPDPEYLDHIIST